MAIISETIRDKVECSEFSNPVGLLPMKLQLLKISMLGRMTPQGHMTSET